MTIFIKQMNLRYKDIYREAKQYKLLLIKNVYCIDFYFCYIR